MASRSGAIAPTAKIIDDMWIHVGLKSGSDVFSATSNLANPVAAVPSLHTAYPVLIMLFFWSAAGRWRWWLPLYPIAMSFALIYTSEHYFFDILLGWLYAIAVYVVGSAVYSAYSERKTSMPFTVATRRQLPWARNRENAGTVAGG
jgi:membrane-associated phospholipid phosphatase